LALIDPVSPPAVGIGDIKLAFVTFNIICTADKI
jgi:hypothetical protein